MPLPKPFTAFIFLLIVSISLPAQVTKIMGTVRDANTGEPIPFANVIIRGTTIGVLTDFEGNYALEFKSTSDSIRAFIMGYQGITEPFRLNQFQTIDFHLTPQQVELPEVTITYKGNPALAILEKVIANRAKNTLMSFDTYQYEAYTKIEIDANNISEKFRNRKLFKPFEFVWSYVDTSTINGKSYLPVFLTETMSDVWFRKFPRSRKEIIKASKISGLENESVSQFLGNLAQDYDVYKDYILVFEKNFVSPLASFGTDFYKYYLVDSLFIGNNWCYHIMFKPKRKQEPTFTGNLWIADTSFAVRRIFMQIADDANINFINDLEMEQIFTWTDSRFWMKTMDRISADFNIIDDAKKIIGFFGHKTTWYSNFIFDVKENKRFSSIPANTWIESGSNNKTDTWWNEARPTPLSKTENGIYEMVDSVKNIPIFKTYVDVVYGIVNGYLTWGKFELGPYFKLFSYNGVEGARFRIGGRTANTFSKRVQLQGYVAYGTLDQRFKYSGDIMLMFGKNPRMALTAMYKNDVEQLGMSPNAFSTDNILTSIFHRGPNDKLTMVQEYNIAYEHEWYNGLINTLGFSHREIFPLGSTEFIIFPESGQKPEFLNSIYTSEICFDTRISFRERFVNGEFYRYTLSSSYPIILIRYAYGIPNVFKSDYEYHKLTVNLQQWFNFSTIGWSKYLIEAGKIWGTLPYPLLKIHEGNQTFLFDEYASNLMNYYEFVSDLYISAYYTHHFDGLLFNHIPLFRKLKWREVVHLRGVYGTLTDQNSSYSAFPGQLRPFGSKPYWEAGVGIENILKFIRVDAIWRMSHLDDFPNQKASQFGVFLSMNFTF
jgi:hypothetical protein